jgi:hypothetical protein
MYYTVKRVDIYDNNKPVQTMADKVPCLRLAKVFAAITGYCAIYLSNGKRWPHYNWEQDEAKLRQEMKSK